MIFRALTIIFSYLFILLFYNTTQQIYFRFGVAFVVALTALTVLGSWHMILALLILFYSALWLCLALRICVSTLLLHISPFSAFFFSLLIIWVSFTIFQFFFLILIDLMFGGSSRSSLAGRLLFSVTDCHWSRFYELRNGS